MQTHPWLAAQIAAARADDIRRAASRPGMVDAAAAAPGVARGRVHRRVLHRVGVVLIATGQRLAGPEVRREALPGALLHSAHTH